MSFVKSVTVRGTEMTVAVIGEGEKPLVMLPGLSVTPVAPSHEVVAQRYAELLDEFTIYLLDIPASIPPDYSSADMAADVAAGMRELGLGSTAIYGVSQGGMIAMCLAANYPELVERLALASTSGNPATCAALPEWISLAEQGDGVELAKGFGQKVYSPAVYEASKAVFEEMGRSFTKEDLAKFAILARADRAFRLDGIVERISCPAFVLASKGDQVFGEKDAKDVAQQLDAGLYVFGEEFGHAVYDEAPDFVAQLKKALHS